MTPQRGAVMVEVLVATLLLGLSMSAMLGGMISLPLQSEKLESRERAALYTNQLLQELRNYVTGSPIAVAGAPGNPPWHMPADTCAGLPKNCWALEEGLHDVSALLPGDLRAKPLRAKLKYEVTVRVIGGRELRDVRAFMEWDD
jgi:type II secretory pathway pseudopilin PulG